jgi:hypothetical protein
MRVCIIRASGKLGKYTSSTRWTGGTRRSACAASRAWRSSPSSQVVPGATDDREVAKRAVAACDRRAVLSQTGEEDREVAEPPLPPACRELAGVLASAAPAVSALTVPAAARTLGTPSA